MTPPTSDQPRPVWLTPLDVQVVLYYARRAESVADQSMLAAIGADWDAAPADPAEAVQDAVMANINRMNWSYTAHAVLRALGAPNTNQDGDDA